MIIHKHYSDMGENGIGATAFEYKITKDVETHTHEFLEIAYIKQGKVVHIINNEKRIVGVGDFIFINYNVSHSFEFINGETCIVINCLFKPQIIDKTLHKCKSFHELLQHYLITFDYSLKNETGDDYVLFDDDKSVLNLLNRIEIEYNNAQTGFVQIIRAYIIEIIIIMMRKLKQKKNEDLNLFVSGDITRAKKLIDENYNKDISLSSISKMLNVSFQYLSRKFSKEVGMGYTEYLQTVRIEQACRLLANTNKKIDEISQLVGYSDTKFFRLKFKFITGITPTQYRKFILH